MSTKSAHENSDNLAKAAAQEIVEESSIDETFEAIDEEFVNNAEDYSEESLNGSIVEDDSSVTLSFEQESECRQLIRDVYSRLMNADGLDFQSLVVRHINDGSVCLSGIVYIHDESPEIDAIACEVNGIENVVNRLVIQSALSASG